MLIQPIQSNRRPAGDWVKPKPYKRPFLKQIPRDLHNFPSEMSVQSFGYIQLNVEQFYIMEGKNEYKHVSV